MLKRINYIFYEAGINNVELVATDNFGTKQSVFKSITVSAPELYLDGSFKDVAYVGRTYASKFDVTTGGDISSDDLSFNLIDAPESMVLDVQNKSIRWNPTILEKGAHEFYLEVSDGRNSFQKKINVDVYELEKVATANSNGGEGNVTIALGDSLGHAYIYHPQNASAYSMNIFKVKDVDWIQFIAETSVPLKNPIWIGFDQDLNVEETINLFSGKAIMPLSRSYPRPSKIVRRVGNETICASDLEMRKYAYGATESQFVKLANKQVTDPNNVFYLDKESMKDPEFSKLMNALNKVNLDETNLKFYIMKDFTKIQGFKEALAIVVPNSTDSIFLNLSKINSFGELYTKYILFHESFHITQNHISGCLSNQEINNAWRPSGYRSLMEGAADYYALKELNSDEQKEISNLEYGNLYPRAIPNSIRIPPNNPYVIGDDVLRDGLFQLNLNSGYLTRIFWEYSPVNMYDFFNKYGENFRNNPNKEYQDSDVIKALKDVQNHSWVSALGATSLGDGIANLSHYLNNYYRSDFTILNYPNNPSLPITKNIYNESLYDWKNNTNSMLNTGCNGEVPLGESCDQEIVDLSGAKKGNGKSFTVKIPPMSARSFRFSKFGSFNGSTNTATVLDEEFTSQMSAMIKITYRLKDSNGTFDDITSKAISVVESNTGRLVPLRNFSLSVKSPNINEEILIGTRGFRYSGLLRPINRAPWDGLNSLGVSNYKATGIQPEVGKDVTDFLWEDGYPVKENIMLDFANTSDNPQELLVIIEPLCERVEIFTPKDPVSGLRQPLKLDFNCQGSCLDVKTINICWRGGVFEGGHFGDHCMFGNTPPMNTYDNGLRFEDIIDPIYDKTTFYVCGEDNNEKRLLNIYPIGK